MSGVQLVRDPHGGWSYATPYRHVLTPALDRLQSDAGIGYLFGESRLSFADLGGRVAQYQIALLRAGVAVGEPVAVCGPPSADWVAAAFGCLAAGAACAPLDHNLTAPELDTMRRRAGIDRFVAIPGTPLSGAEAVTAGRAAARITELRGSDDDVAVVLHTSGSTGTPKAVQLTHRNLVQSLHSFIDVFGCSQADRTCIAVPLFHVTGLVDQLLQMLWLGGTCRILDRYSTDGLLSSLSRDGITVVYAVPTVLALLARRRPPRNLPLRLAVYGGSPTGRPTFDALIDALPDLRAVQGYGMTEMTSLATALPFDRAHSEPTSVGVPSPITELRIVDDSGDPCEPLAIGEIQLRGPHRTPGYLGDPAASAAAIDEDGWLHSGDLAWRDSDGLVYLAGRRSEIINRGGEKISPREIESVLLDVPGITEVVAFAAPHPLFFEVPAAAIVVDAEAGPSDRHIRRVLDDRLAPFKHPTSIRRLRRIPLSANGKPDLSALRAELAQ